MTVAILAHGRFPNRAKTAVGILRYGDQDVAAVLDRDNAGERVAEHVADVQDAPIVESMADAPRCDTLIIGIAPIGGGFDESWRADVETAIERGCDVVAGLHHFLNDDPEFARLADDHEVDLWDVRRPPEDLTVAEGTASDVDAQVVLTVGTDCSTGKMTSSFAIRDAARERGLNADVIPTGQTGILVDGWGIAVDRVVSDFAAGAVERLVEERGDRDLLVVEGQGALAHPAYSGVTLSILHGAQPDDLVLCHEAGTDVVHSYEDFDLPAPAAYAGLYEDVARPVKETEVVAGMLNTSGLDESQAGEAVADYEAELGVPATDPVRYGVGDDVLDAILD
ncbi:DUF1611 domain-containing protein [Halobacteriales archaeon Cl-PHB]